MALTKTQQELIGAIGALEPVATPYWNLFAKAKTPYLALSDTIRVDEVIANYTKAGIVPRGTALPPIKVGGYNQLTIKPDIVGGAVGISAMDTLNQEAGEVVVLNGKQIKAKDYDRVRKLQELKNAVDNTKEDLAAGALLKGSIKDANGEEVELGLESEESKTKGKLNWVIVLTNLVKDYKEKTKHYPDAIFIGSKIANSLLNEIHSSEKHVLTSTVKLENDSLNIIVGGFALPVQTFPFNDIGVDTDTKVTLYKNLCLLPCYAGLEYVGTTGNSEMIRAEIIVDKTEPNRETGQGKIFAKSAPLPLIALPGLIRRYTFSDVQ